MERMALSSIFRASLDTYESAIEWAGQVKPKPQENDTRFLAQAVANLAAALRYLTMLQDKAAHYPDEDMVKEVMYRAWRAQCYADAKIPSDGVIAVLPEHDFSDLARYRSFLRRAVLCAAECMISLGDLLCQGDAHDVGRRGGVIVGISRITFYVRGLDVPADETPQEEVPDGGAH